MTTTTTTASLTPSSFDRKTALIESAVKTHLAEIEIATSELREALAAPTLAIPSSALARRKALDRYNREVQRAAGELKGGVEMIERS